MANDLFYKPGSWYRIDELSGFKVRAEKTKKTWYGTYRADDNWEPRNAQDFVRGVADDQTVPDARPPAPPTFVPLPSFFMMDQNGDLVLDQFGMPIQEHP